MQAYEDPSDAALDAEIARTQARGKQMQLLYAREMHYHEFEDAFFLRLFSGVMMTVPRALIPRFDSVSLA